MKLFFVQDPTWLKVEVIHPQSYAQTQKYIHMGGDLQKRVHVYLQQFFNNIFWILFLF